MLKVFQEKKKVLLPPPKRKWIFGSTNQEMNIISRDLQTLQNEILREIEIIKNVDFTEFLPKIVYERRFFRQMVENHPKFEK